MPSLHCDISHKSDQMATSITNIVINWPLPPKNLALANDELDIWAAQLDQQADRIEAHLSTLSEHEKARASAFRFQIDRNRFICSHGILRAILGRYLELDPHQLQFNYGSRGKPELAGLSEANALHFNMTHSEGLGVFACTRACPVGVDVERVRAIRDEQEVANLCFASRESEALSKLDGYQKMIGFYNLWTRKEAWLKATGQGICDSLRSLEVSLLPGEPARIISICGNEKEGDLWSLVDLSPATDFKATVAFAEKNLKIRSWGWFE